MDYTPLSERRAGHHFWGLGYFQLPFTGGFPTYLEGSGWPVTHVNDLNVFTSDLEAEFPGSTTQIDLFEDNGTNYIGITLLSGEGALGVLWDPYQDKNQVYEEFTYFDQICIACGVADGQAHADLNESSPDLCVGAATVS